jgi:hypothetical protein
MYSAFGKLLCTHKKGVGIDVPGVGGRIILGWIFRK